MHFSRKSNTTAKYVFFLFLFNIIVSLWIYYPKIMKPNTTTEDLIQQQQRLLDFLRSETTNNQINVSLTMAKHLFYMESHQNKTIVFSPLSLQVVLSIIAAGSESPTQHQLLHFLQSKSTDQLNSSPLTSSLSFSKTLLLPVDLASLLSIVCGLNKPFPFNLPSNKLCLLIIKQLCLLLISRTRYVSISALFSLQNSNADFVKILYCNTCEKNSTIYLHN
jgi:hypothetical protein